MTTARTIVLVLHIISAGCWTAEIIVELVSRPFLRANEGQPLEANLMLLRARIQSTLGSLGGFGILFTGFGLIAVDGLGFLGIGGGVTPTWLFIKQVIFLIALILVFTLLIPASVRGTRQLVEATRRAGSVTPEIRQLYTRVDFIGRFNNLLVLVNIILAVWKPM
jgi:hypothetical protein